jgi:hypothetical protein
VIDADRPIAWLLESPEPAIRRLARRDLLREPSDEDVLDGPLVQTLLVDHDVHPYAKWRGAHWRLISLVELGVAAGEPRSLAAAERVLAWLTGKGHRSGSPTIAGRVRRCASQEGNALAVCVRLGLAEDPRVELLARSLVEWQWSDGGWNCDRRPEARRSSFLESLAPAWGLHEYSAATGADWAHDAADSAAELFLSLRLFRSLRSGDVINPTWLEPHYPPYWHYDAAEARDALASRQGKDGLWSAARAWWRRPGAKGSNVEVVDWGQKPSAMVTLNALRVLL